MRIAGLILAAGASRRFGADKRLHEIDGRAMLARTVGRYREVLARVVVTLRPGEPAIARLVADAGGEPVPAPDADAGQARSLAAGIAAVTDADAAIVGLGDMPFVTARTLEAIRAGLAANPGRVIRPHCGGRPGNPVGFPSALFGELMAIDGDRGARDLLEARPERVLALAVDDPGVLRDVDRPDDVRG